VHALGIPDDMPLVALVNGHEVETSHSLQGDDVVTLFPPLAGG
jgi:molybdopterin converting factor small subunit